jgi:hypothetical protein
MCTKNQRKERKGFLTHSQVDNYQKKTAHDVVCKIQARKKESKQAASAAKGGLKKRGGSA